MPELKRKSTKTEYDITLTEKELALICQALSPTWDADTREVYAKLSQMLGADVTDE